MSRSKSDNIVSLIILSYILIKNMGFMASINLIYEMFKLINNTLQQLYNTSILSFAFKYCITFPTVGIILSSLGSPRGKEGHIIGRILYFIIGYVVCIILDNIATLIF